MPLTRKTRHLVLGMAMLAAIAAPAWAQAAPVTDEPGVCWSYNRNGTKPADRAVGAFCFQLRDGVLGLSQGQGTAAFERFRAAEQAAAVIPDPQARALARDEARAGLALTLEAMDRPGEAVALLGLPGQAQQRDTLALARGFMLARQEDYDGAIRALEGAKRQMPEFWCDTTEQALTAIRARAGGHIADWPPIANDHSLPSYLTPALADGHCASKSSLASVPTSRAFQAAFDLGEREPGPKTEPALQDMAAHIAAQSRRLGDGWLWVLVGHADQACPRDRTRDCARYNMDLSRDRAERVKNQLDSRLRRMGAPAIALRVDYRGMEEPLYPRGFGVADQRNRRVQLVPKNTQAAGGPTPRCPWEVTVHRADIAGNAVPGGGVSTPTMILAPGATVEISHDALYSVRYVPGPGSADMRYFYAFAETESTAKADLAATAGLAANDLTTLQAQGGRLPQGKVFRPDAQARQEVIHLYVTDAPVAQLEAIRRAPIVAAAPGTPMTPVRYLARADGGLVTLADLRYRGATKDWNNNSPHIPADVNLTIEAAPAAMAATPAPVTVAPPPVAAATITPPPAPPMVTPGKTPTVLACTFRLSMR